MRRAIAITYYCVVLVVGGLWALVQWLAPWLRDVVGAPGYLDDAATWQREWLPVISAILTPIDLWLQSNGYWVLLFLGALSFAAVHILPGVVHYIRSLRSGPFTVHFAFDMRDFHTGHDLLVDGEERNTKLSIHQCRFSVTNQPSARTARNVKAIVTLIAEGAQDIDEDIQLPCFGHGDGPLAVHPGQTKYFQFLEFIEPLSLGFWDRHMDIDASMFETLSLASRPDSESFGTMPTTMAIPYINGGRRINNPIKGDRVQIDVAIYSRHNIAMYLNFEITRAERILVRLLRQSLIRPKGKSADTRSP